MAIAVKKIMGIARASIKKVAGKGNSGNELFTHPLFSDGNLQGYWRLEADGVDSGPNGYDIAAGTSPSFVVGKFGNGADFEASSSQYLTRASVANLRITGSQTWGCWMKLETASLSRAMGRVNASPTFNFVNLGVSVGTGVGAHASFQAQNLATNTYVEGAATMSTGIWYFMVGIYDSANTKLKVWLNDVKTEVTASGSTSSAGTEAFSLGRAGAYAGDYFDGIIDDAFVFNRALTDAEVLSLYNTMVKKFAGVSNV